MLQTEIDKLNDRLQEAFQTKRLLASGLVIPVKTDDGQLLYDAQDNSRPVTLEDWADAQVFYVQEDSSVSQTKPNRWQETFEVSAVIYTAIPEFEEFFKSQLRALGFEYTGSNANPVRVVNQFLPNLAQWNHERALYALTFNVTLPLLPAACINTCF